MIKSFFKTKTEEEITPLSNSSNNENLRILLIEDERIMYELIKRIIGHVYAFPVDYAESAEEGIKLYEKYQHQIIISDIRLKGKLNGIDFVRHIKKKDLVANIIMITAYGTPEIAVECMQAGAWDFISKPFTHEHFIIIVERAIQNLQLKKKAREREYFGELKQLDGLTKTHNRQIFDFVIKSEIIRSERHNEQFSLIIVDIDNFKKINEQFGHDKGDFILIQLSNYLKHVCRDSDFLCRLRDDEFAIILPETTKEGTNIYIKRIEEKLKGWQMNEATPITVSIGVAIFPDNAKDQNTLLNNAELALYDAKKSDKKIIYYDENSLN